MEYCIGTFGSSGTKIMKNEPIVCKVMTTKKQRNKEAQILEDEFHGFSPDLNAFLFVFTLPVYYFSEGTHGDLLDQTSAETTI